MKNGMLLFLVILSACNAPVGDKPGGKCYTVRKKNSDTARRCCFLQEDAEGSRTEIALGRFGSGHATDQRLKDYGYQMISKHEGLLARLKILAVQRGVSLPDTVNAKHQQLISWLSPKGGNPFDSTYMAVIINHQKELVRNYDAMGRNGSDSALRIYAREATPILINQVLGLITIRDSINIKK